VNHCLLEVEVLEVPRIRYTQDSQTPVAEMPVQVDGLRPDDPPGVLKVVGWGNLAQDLQNRIRPGQRLVVEGRLRMNTVTRQDGLREKRAEFTLSRLHPLGPGGGADAGGNDPRGAGAGGPRGQGASARPAADHADVPVWNTSPLNPEDMAVSDDEIPF
jgi:single-stranded DNA-binding protein